VKKKILLIPLALLLAISLVATGCAAPAPAPAPKPAPPKEVVWKMNAFRPATQMEIPYMQLACDEIYERTNGRLKIDIYPGLSLGHDRSTWLRDIKAGVIDISCIYNAYTAGEEPSFTVGEMPQIWRSREQGLLAANAFFSFKKKVYKEVWGGEMVGMGTILEGGRENIFTKGKVIRSIDDMQGLKIRTPGGRYKELFTELGVAPQSLALGDVYMAMKTGVIDGLRTGSGTVNQIKLYEVADQAVKLGSWGALSQDLVVSDRVWDELPADLQEIVRDVWKRWGEGMFAHVIHCPYVDDLYWQKRNEAEGMTYGKMPEEELAKIRKVALKILAAWAEKEGGRPLEAYEIIKPFVVAQTEPGVPVMFSK